VKIHRIAMKNIRKGDVVAGDVTGWWRVTRIDADRNGSIVLTGTNTATGKTGQLWGNANDIRDCAK
jgi:hypothetical protein